MSALKISERTKELLRKRANRRGKSLEAGLRDELAKSEVQAPDDDEPFDLAALPLDPTGPDWTRVAHELGKAQASC